MEPPTTPVKSRFHKFSTPKKGQSASKQQLSTARHIYFTPSKYGSPVRTRRQKLPETLDQTVVLELGPTSISAAFSGKNSAHATIETYDDPLWQYKHFDSGEFETRLIKSLTELFIDQLLITGHGYAFVVVESAFLTNPIKTILTSTLREIFHASSTVFLPACTCALIQRGCEHGIVVEFGYYETAITLVYDLRPLVSLTKITLRSYSRLQDLDPGIDIVEYYLGTTEDNTPNDDCEDEDEHYLPYLVNEAIALSDIDLRIPISRHIVLVGCPDVSNLGNTLRSKIRIRTPDIQVHHVASPLVGCSAYLSSIYTGLL